VIPSTKSYPLSLKMTTQVQGSNILDVLKKKMRQTKEEMEKYKEDSEELQKKLQVEIMRREEVRKRNEKKAH
jgi:tropomyosin-1